LGRRRLTTEPNAGRFALGPKPVVIVWPSWLPLVLEAAHDGQPVGDRRLERHQFAEIDTGNVGADRLELAANLDGASGFMSYMSMWLGPPGR